MQKISKRILFAGFIFSLTASNAFGNDIYGPFPITLKGYSGDKTNSVSYSGQIARHILHDSLKKLAASGDKAEMMAFFKGSDKNKEIIAPKTKGDFKIKQTLMNDVSKG